MFCSFRSKFHRSSSTKRTLAFALWIPFSTGYLAATPTSFALLPAAARQDSSPAFHSHRSQTTPQQGGRRQLSFLGSSTAEEATTKADTMTPQEKLDLLRKRMKDLDLDVYLIPSDDPHLSEYVPEAYKRRAFLTGFGGSAGTAVVTATSAHLWTDSRYWNEASMHLDDTLWELQKAGIPATPTIPKWLADTAKNHFESTKKSLRIGMDPYVHASAFAKELKKLLEETAKDEGWTESIGDLVTEHSNLVDPVWGKARPALPLSPFRVHPLVYAGRSVADKLADLRKEMATKKAAALVLCSLDDVAYAFNIRATGDIDTCPVGIAYAIISEKDAVLYCDAEKIVDIKDHLVEGGATVQPYDRMIQDLQSIQGKVWIDASRANLAISDAVPSAVDAQNPITSMKAVKNEAELEGMREAHIVDGVAMAKFMTWLEAEVLTKGRSISEVEIDQVLTGYRAKEKGFIECSFPTIAGVGANGAIIHYSAQPNTEVLKSLDTQSPILIDSGGQYAYGTTDVTRTWSFQENPDPEFVDYYTRVLKGHIGLDIMIFPEDTPGFVLDVYARRWLWDVGVDYGHGTGHGVGAALNVHEGPMSISPRWKNTEGLKEGMVVSNEPGYYEDGRFGIRIENLLEITAVKDPKKKKFLKFSKLTMIPIQKNLIKLALMTEEELDWLDSYHAEVLRRVGSRLERGSPAYAWLEKSCAPIERNVKQ